jgi:hypothetical protein
MTQQLCFTKWCVCSNLCQKTDLIVTSASLNLLNLLPHVKGTWSPRNAFRLQIFSAVVDKRPYWFCRTSFTVNGALVRRTRNTERVCSPFRDRRTCSRRASWKIEGREIVQPRLWNHWIHFLRTSGYALAPGERLRRFWHHEIRERPVRSAWNAPRHRDASQACSFSTSFCKHKLCCWILR